MFQQTEFFGKTEWKVFMKIEMRIVNGSFPFVCFTIMIQTEEKKGTGVEGDQVVKYHIFPGEILKGW